MRCPWVKFTAKQHDAICAHIYSSLAVLLLVKGTLKWDSTLFNYLTRLDSSHVPSSRSEFTFIFEREKRVRKCRYARTILPPICWHLVWQHWQVFWAKLSGLIARSTWFNLRVNNQKADINHKVGEGWDSMKMHCINQCDIVMVVVAAATNSTWYFLFFLPVADKLELQTFPK